MFMLHSCRVFTREVYYGYCLPRFPYQTAIIRGAVYTELINKLKQAAYNGRFQVFLESEGCNVAQKLLENYKISDFTPMPNAGRCQFACSDVKPNSPLMLSFVDEQWKENFDISLNLFLFLFKRHLPRSTGYVNVYRYFFLFGATLNSNICFSSPQTSIMIFFLILYLWQVFF